MQNDSLKFAYVPMGSLNTREMLQRRAGGAGAAETSGFRVFGFPSGVASLAGTRHGHRVVVHGIRPGHFARVKSPRPAIPAGGKGDDLQTAHALARHQSVRVDVALVVDELAVDEVAPRTQVRPERFVGRTDVVAATSWAVGVAAAADLQPCRRSVGHRL